MTPPRNAYKRQRQQARTARHEAKRRAITQSATKRQRTRAQTPELWRNRVKGRAVRKRPAVVAIPRILPLAA